MAFKILTFSNRLSYENENKRKSVVGMSAECDG